MEVRKTRLEELELVMDIYHRAQDVMAERGNPSQWGHFYPTKAMIEDDILKGRSYVLMDKEQILGVFMLLSGADPSYSYIEDGEWPNDEEYLTIHRIASSGIEKGVFRGAFDYARSICSNVRVDTHKDNIAMQAAIERCGFKRCGVIYVDDGTPRIAYHS